jgi:nicotinamide phosphoribosyltransferase
MENINPFLCTDAYKASHHKQYPKGTTLVYSNFTPRSNKYGPKGCDKVVSFGQQMVMRQIKEMFDEHFFKQDIGRVTGEICTEYSLLLGTDYDVSHIVSLHELGYLPIKVKAIQEGTLVPIRVPILTIVNTNPEFFWLTNFLETLISNLLWKPVTSATIAYQYKKNLSAWAMKTDPTAIGFVDFQGHDFSMRGMDSVDATISSGLGHATSFMGSDSLPVIHGARKYYGEKGFVIGSVNATEHSVMCAGGADEGDELQTIKNLMETFPTGILSIVSDTWDLWKVITMYLPELKNEILARDGKLVIRPDSGDPVDIICGTFDPRYDHPGSNLTPATKGVIELLWDIFGGTTNEQGYKILDSHIGAIYGDSITLDRAEEICKRLHSKGFASTNIVLGIGSFTYQYNTRDTFGFAMKATYVEIQKTYTEEEVKESLSEMGFVDLENCWDEMAINEGFEFNEKTNLWTFDEDRVEGREIFKDPITDDGQKKSAKGLLRVQPPSACKSGVYELFDQQDKSNESKGALQIIFEDGEFSNTTTLTEIREKLKQ